MYLIKIITNTNNFMYLANKPAIVSGMLNFSKGILTRTQLHDG